MVTDPKEIGKKITGLRKAGDLTQALELGYSALQSNPSSWAIRGALAWVVRDAKIKAFSPQHGQPEELLDAVREIKGLTDFGLYGEISVFVTGSFEAANTLVEMGQFEAALEILRDLDRESLSNKPNEFGGKSLPNQVQRWYSGMAKVLEKLERWDETIEICKEALSSGLFPSQEEAVWFHYRLALAQVDSNPTVALAEIEIVGKTKKEWWVIGQKGRCLRALGREEEALDAFKTALGGIKSGGIAFGIKLLEEMFELVTDSELQTLIVQTLRKIRIDSGWPTKDKYEEMAEDVGAGDPSDFSIEDALTRLADRTAFQNVRGAPPRGRKERIVLFDGVTGIVKRLIGEVPTAGFVQVEGHGDVFMSKHENPDLAWPPAVGARITGNLIKGYDKKKDRESVNIADSRLA
jgi:tetratricopeptide (TPR) repeat protein